MPLNLEGFAAVRLTVWREECDHQHQNVITPPSGSSDPILGDLAQCVDINYGVWVARLNAVIMATLASAPGQPRDVIIVSTRVENGTTLE